MIYIQTIEYIPHSIGVNSKLYVHIPNWTTSLLKISVVIIDDLFSEFVDAAM